MVRSSKAALAALFVASIVWTAQLSAPDVTLACSCFMPDPDAIGKVDDPATIVFIGRVVDVRQGMDNQGHTFGTLMIERVFKGSVPRADMTVVGGGGGDCTIGISPGQHMITAARVDGTTITPGLCAPYGDPSTAEGQRLIQVAERAYGAGIVPPDGPGDTGDPAPAPTTLGDVGLAAVLGGSLLVVVLLFGGIALLARRRTTP